ncbi:hypothetical protein E0Z10_g8407 [Xylaria hypoxylon]|uniref:Uncharacterized protein n=1 Tax=Xylaria hypoxylon TaxID=37992 RepID=A0A4Z0Y861_9PEZI|nr:hypothetical protein E0Z10_g8407 [Xylaria hypoxylon]
MAPAVAEIAEAKVVISRIGILSLEGTPHLTRLSVEVPMPIRDEPDYSTTSTTNSSYYNISTGPTSTLSSLTTVVISITEIITLTTIVFITSESIVTLLGPTEAPLLSSTSTNLVLSPGKIAGITLGALIGLLIFVLLFYLLLTRSKWVPWFDKRRFEIREKKHTKKPKRRPKKSVPKKPTNRAKNPVRNPTSVRNASDGKQAEPKPTVKTRSASIHMTPEQRQYELAERGEEGDNLNEHPLVASVMLAIDGTLFVNQ